MIKNVKQSGKEFRRRRIRAKIYGTSEKPRLCVYRSLTRNYASLIDDKSGKTLVSASDIKEKKSGNIESAKKIGLELAKKALESKIETCVFDRSGYKYHGRVKAIAEAAREGGLKF